MHQVMNVCEGALLQMGPRSDDGAIVHPERLGNLWLRCG
jgi:hypothetical protein